MRAQYTEINERSLISFYEFGDVYFPKNKNNNINNNNNNDDDTNKPKKQYDILQNLDNILITSKINI